MINGIVASGDVATNVAPDIISNGGGPTASISVEEGTAKLVTTVVATDADGDDITYSIVGGADAARFAIVPLSGALFLTADYENPNDANADNVYEVTVGATDGTVIITQALSVTVTDKADETAPTITSASEALVGDGVALSHSLTANETVTWTIVGGADAALFEINGSNTLRFLANATHAHASPADANGDNAYLVNVRATDASSNTADQSVTVLVTDSSGWATVYNVTRTNSDGAGVNGNWRSTFTASFLAGGTNKVRVTFMSGTSGGASIDKAAIGHKAASGNAWDYSGDQVAVTFDGGSAGFTIGDDATKVSDEISFTFSKTDDLVVAMHVNNTATQFGGAVVSGNSSRRNISTTADESLTTVPSSSYFSAGTATYGVKKIEVKA